MRWACEGGGGAWRGRGGAGCLFNAEKAIKIKNHYKKYIKKQRSLSTLRWNGYFEITLS